MYITIKGDKNQRLSRNPIKIPVNKELNSFIYPKKILLDALKSAFTEMFNGGNPLVRLGMLPRSFSQGSQLQDEILGPINIQLWANVTTYTLTVNTQQWLVLATDFYPSILRFRPNVLWGCGHFLRFIPHNSFPKRFGDTLKPNEVLWAKGKVAVELGLGVRLHKIASSST